MTLKASPYGGTAAIVLIPRHLVVTEEAFRSGLPGEPAMAQLVANGNSGLSELDGMPGLGQPPGVRISGPLRRSALGAANGAAGNGADELPRRHGQREAASEAANGGALPFGDQPTPFPGWTLHNTPGSSGGRAATGSPAPARPPGRRGSSPARPDRFPRRRVRPGPRRLAGLPGPADRTGRGPTATSRTCRAGSSRPTWHPSCGTTRRPGERRWPAAGRRALRGLRAPQAQRDPRDPRDPRDRARRRSARPCWRCSAAGRKAGRDG